MHSIPETLTRPRLGVVGAGRLGRALSTALRRAGYPLEGPVRRGERPLDCEAILLCVPDAEIAAAAEAQAGAAPLIGHTSGATGLGPLEPAGAAARFALHPLQTFVGEESSAAFRGAGCAVAGSTPAALALARRIAADLGMTPVELDDSGRPAYHAAASMASNFLLALEAAAERLAGGAGLEHAQARLLLAPLVRQTVRNWERVGPERALTGPVARGDEDTVAAQRASVEQHAPELLRLFDALVERTRALAGAAVPT